MNLANPVQIEMASPVRKNEAVSSRLVSAWGQNAKKIAKNAFPVANGYINEINVFVPESYGELRLVRNKEEKFYVVISDETGTTKNDEFKEIKATWSISYHRANLLIISTDGKYADFCTLFESQADRDEAYDTIKKVWDNLGKNIVNEQIIKLHTKSKVNLKCMLDLSNSQTIV